MPRPIRLRLIIALAAATAIAASIYALGSRPEPRFSAALTSLSLSPSFPNGGSNVTLSIAFSGTPDVGDYVRVRAADDITGWSFANPPATSGDYTFSNSDMTGRYFDVPIYNLTSPVTVTVETVNPTSGDDADTKVTGKLNDAGTQRASNTITILHQ